MTQHLGARTTDDNETASGRCFGDRGTRDGDHAARSKSLVVDNEGRGRIGRVGTSPKGEQGWLRRDSAAVSAHGRHGKRLRCGPSNDSVRPPFGFGYGSTGNSDLLARGESLAANNKL